MENEEKVLVESDGLNNYKKIIKYGIYLIGIGILCLLILFSYVDIQRYLLAPENTILFVDNYEEYERVVSFFSFSPLLIYIGYILCSKDLRFFYHNSILFNFILRPKILILLSTLILLLGFTVISTDFSYIDQNGIYDKPDIFTKEKHYTFSHVNRVEVKTEYGNSKGTYNNLFVRYVIYFDDNSKVNIASSLDFWNEIIQVQGLLEKNGIQINRELINDDKCMKLMYTYDYLKELRNLKTLEDIFNYKTSLYH